MEIINNTTYYKNTVNNSYTQEASKVSKAAEIKSEEKINNSDSIELSTTDANAVNTKKAYDAMVEVNNEYLNNGDEHGQMIEFLVLCRMMKDNGMTVPDFSENNKEGFVDFIDKIKSYAQDLLERQATSSYASLNTLSSKFLDFCDSYKEKLIEYGCN